MMTAKFSMGLNMIVFGALLAVMPTTAAATAPGGNGSSMVIAVLPFTTSGEELKDMGAEVSTLFNAFLSQDSSLIVVERGEVDKSLSEIELGLSGAIHPATAAKVGYLTGAQVLVTGRLFPMQNDLIIVAKIIGVETGRVYGATQTMPLSGSIVEASEALVDKIKETLSTKGATLTAHLVSEQDIVERLQHYVKGKSLPSLTVVIGEQSLGRGVPDPAAETEIAHILKALGFRVLDPATSRERPDVEITGEAFSEFGMRRGNLVSSKGRVELKSITSKTGDVVFVDRAVAVAIDLSPEIAGKKSISKAATRLVERLVSSLVRGL